MLEAVNNRVDPFILKGENSDNIPEDLWDGVQTFVDNYVKFRKEWNEKAHKLTNTQWRKVKRDCRMIEAIPLHRLEKDWNSICKEFCTLGKQGSFVYEDHVPKKARMSKEDTAINSD